ncbi:MAG: 2-hydroxyacyl-CoA dehydratase family protein [Pseudoclavibacter sp.]
MTAGGASRHIKVPGGPARIGVIGADVPRQLVLASGAVPVRIFGAWSGPVSDEAARLPGAVDAAASRILDSVLAGEHDQLAGLIVCNDAIAHLRIFYVLRILADRGRIPFPVHLLDAPRGGGTPRDRFVAWQFTRMLDFCRSVTGARADPDSLASAAAREADLGRAVRRMREARLRGAIGGVRALDAYRAAATLDPADAVRAVEAAMRSAGAVSGGASSDGAALDGAVQGGDPVGRAARGDGTPAAPTRPTVFVTGSGHPDSSVYAAMEEAGITVIGEDHDAGDAAWFGDAALTGDTTPFGDSLARDIAASGSPETAAALEAAHAASGAVEATIAALTVRFAARPPVAARSRTSERVRELGRRLDESRPTGIIALVRDLDDASAWDLAAGRALATERGIPFVARTRIAGDPPDAGVAAGAAAAREIAERIATTTGDSTATADSTTTTDSSTIGGAA